MPPWPAWPRVARSGLHRSARLARSPAQAGELYEVTAEVDPYLEIAEITDRVTKSGGPALLFSNVKGSQMPLVINQFGTERRMCMAFGVDRLDELGERVAEVLEMAPPEGLMDKIRALGKLKSLADSRPKTVSLRPLPGDRARSARHSTRCRS